MIRHGNWLAGAGVMAAALIWAPAVRAVDSDQASGRDSGRHYETLSAHVDDLTRAIDSLKQEMTQLQKTQTDLSVALARAQADLKVLQAPAPSGSRVAAYGPSDPAAASEFAEIRRGLDRMAQDIASLRANQSATGPRVSLYPVPETVTSQCADLAAEVERLRRHIDRLSPAPAVSSSNYPAAATGRIRLVNEYVLPMDVIIDGRTYRVEPGQTRDVLGVPAGNFTYRVPTLQAENQTRYLAANGTYTITTYPQ